MAVDARRRDHRSIPLRPTTATAVLTTYWKDKPVDHALSITEKKEEGTVIRTGYRRSNRVDRFHLHHERRTGGDTEPAEEVGAETGRHTREGVRVGGPPEGS
ncbi:hypothetical protein [Streptomyces shenzhenensis]|uniref:hypothetical protein n=1 Tax=Streptomyces shenzhenensis TaxID=943815 RepID=UPI001F273CB9|nr:hypothetical protein [Streptomyces shenzhenensis]